MPSILQRLTDIGLAEDRVRQHLASGFVRVGAGDGTVIKDAETEVDAAERVRFQPEPVTDHV